MFLHCKLPSQLLRGLSVRFYRSQQKPGGETIPTYEVSLTQRRTHPTYGTHWKIKHDIDPASLLEMTVFETTWNKRPHCWGCLCFWKCLVIISRSTTIVSHYCFCSVMLGQSYCFMWYNDAMNLRRPLKLHFFFSHDMFPSLLAYRHITLIKALILVWLQMLVYSITSNSTGYTEVL